MGNQCQNIDSISTEKPIFKELSIDTTNEANIEFMQEFDNPKRSILNSNFLSGVSCSSNYLQTISSRQKINIGNNNSSRRFSLIKIDSIDVDKEFQPTVEEREEDSYDSKMICIDEIKQSTNFIKRDNRTSLCDNMNIKGLQKKTNLKEKKNQSVNNKATQKVIEIKPENFVSVKQTDIEKHYQFICKLGQGTYGNVMKAMCLRTNQFRAIKILKKIHDKKEKKGSDEGPDMNLQQLKILRKLDHPNIVKLFQVYYWNQSYYLVLEYCQGGSILSYLRQSRSYCQNIVKKIIKQLLSALSYMHALKIAHRDIKLQNIVFINKVSSQSRQEDVQIKIIDFGEAFELKFSHNNKDRREIGTLTYMAPEVLEGLYSEKCDIWSCGVILWILLSGKNPFRRNSKRQTIDSIKNLQLSFRNEFWQQIPQNLKILLNRMLQPSPFKRITAKQALSNTWFSQETQTIENTKMKDVVSKLYDYYRESNLISVIESYLSFVKITQQERTDITRLFKKLDTDNSGSIDIDQLKNALKLCTENGNDPQLDYVLSKVDKCKSRKIDFNQFVTALYDRKKLFHQKSLELAFDYFDNDKNGYIDKKELKAVLKGCDQEQINKILKDIDENGDQRISKEEFITYIREQRFL